MRDLGRVETTAVYRTVVGRAVRPGDADNSDVLIRVRSRDPWWGMPALGTEELDHDGIELLARWIRRAAHGAVTRGR